MMGARDDLRQMWHGFPDSVAEDVSGLFARAFDLQDGGGARSPLSYIGGVPRMSPALDWPRPGLADQAEEIAARAAPDLSAYLTAHLRADVPLSLVAQIDLADLAALHDQDASGALAADLPAEGRLLFFYDMLAGPFHSGAQTGRVLWDTAPRADVVPFAVPAEMRAAEDRHREETRRQLAQSSAQIEAMRQVLRDAGLSEAEIAMLYDQNPEDFPAPFRTRPRPLSVVPVDLLVPLHALEFDRLASADLLRRRDLGPAGPDDPDFIDRYEEVSWSLAPLRSGAQLLGPPRPEQDDPRLDAVAVTRLGLQHLTQDIWQLRRDEVMQWAAEWRLLLQMPLQFWSNDTGDGTVYFLIRADDLAARDFSAVVAVYQQT